MSAYPSKAEYFVQRVHQLDLRHRSGLKPSEESLLSYLAHLSKEVKELHEAVVVHAIAFFLHGAEGSVESRMHVLEETADAFVCLLQLMQCMDVGFVEMDEEAKRKIFLRFEDMDIIKEDTC